MTVNYQYSNDRLSKITTPTTDYTFTYDSFGRNTKIKSGDYFLSDTSYNSNGLVASQSLLNGTHTREYTYDELDRIKTEKRNNNTLTYYYGSNGELSYVTDSKTGTRTQYEYDLADRITSVKEFSGTQPYLFDLNSSLSYTYVDGKNQIDTITAKTELGENKLDIFYGSIQNGGIPDVVSMEWRNGSLSKAYFYDSLGRISKTRTKTGGSLLDVSYTYKTVSGNRTSTQVSSLATPAGTFSYAYDNRGNISSVSDGTYTTTYTYDNLNQLIREDNEKNNRTYVYAYSNGNLLSRSAYEYTAPNVTPTDVLHVYGMEYTAYTWKDLLVKYDGVSMAYDGNGQITSFDGMALSWDYLGLLGSAGNTTYSYDTSGRRLSKTTGSTVTNYYYAGDLLVGQKTGNNKIEFIYDSNGDYYGFEYNDVPYNYIKNLQGDVIAIANGSGNIIVRYEYDAWGRHLNITDTTGIRLGNINPIRYRGYYFDEETGFYYLKTRYYSPEICRFLSADMFIDNRGVNTQNLFAYCANNPVNYVDITGMFWAEVKVCLSVLWCGAKIWAKNTFGAGYTTTATISKEETPIIPDPSPITVISGVTTTQIVSQSGDSTKPISVYADKNVQHPIISSTAGIKLNTDNFALNLSLGLENFGVYGSWTKDNTTEGFGLKINPLELKFGFEGFTSIFNDGTTVTSYTNFSINGWLLAVAFAYFTTGQPVPVPKPVTAPA